MALCLHAAAVIMDALKQYEPALPADLLPFQTAAFQRSRQLASQLAQALKIAPPIPTAWKPVDLDDLAGTLAPAPAPPPPPVDKSLFPSVPK